MKKEALASLIFPHTKNEFIKSYSDNKPFVIHQLKQSIQELTDLPFLESIETLFKVWPKDVDICPLDISDEQGALTTPIGQIEQKFSAGHVLLFNDANTINPVLDSWLKQLRLDLGLSSMTFARNLIYVAKKGSGTTTHFDQNMNFVLQVHGTKKWWIAPNENVENPMSRHTLGHPVEPELASYSTSPMPHKIPENATEFRLSEGSMLFVPRGVWHSTESITDTLSLNFTFSAPTWIDLFSLALRGRLMQSPEWRETANFVSDPHKKEEAIERFNALLSSLSYEVPHWQAKDILDAIEND